MDTQRFQRLRELFEAALELAAEQRAALLERCRGEDRDLAAELERMLASELQPSFLRPLDEPDVSPPPARIGPFELRECLGQGGFATVYRAEQLEPVRREVALKVLHVRHPSRDARLRFELERQALARMQHPGIARFFDAGETPQGQVYFAMEYVHGEPLTAWSDAARSSVKVRLELMAELCDAVQHAHQRGVVHRDLKPSNVLVTHTDGRPRAVVIDFGVAKFVAEAEAKNVFATREGVLIGTPAYMSPEQAHGEAIDTRTDVYALGVLLYVLLSGELPFDAERRIAGSPTPPPRRLASAFHASPQRQEIAAKRGTNSEALAQMLRGDAEWIARKALEHDPERRYASASEFASDLRALLAQRPVSARQPEAWYYLRRFAARHRLGLSVSAALVALMLLSIVSLARAFHAAQRARSAEAEFGRRTELQRQQAVLSEYVAHISAAQAALDAGDVVGASAKLRAAPLEHRGWEWRHLAARCVAPARSFSFEQRPLEAAWLDERRLFVSGYMGARIVDTDSATNLCTTDDPELALLRVALDLPRERFLAIAQERNEVRLELRSLGDLGVLSVLDDIGDPPRAVAFAPDGRHVAVGCNDGGTRIIPLEGGRSPFVLCRSRASVIALTYGPGGDVLFVADANRLSVRDASDGREIAALSHPIEPFSAICASSDRERVYAACGQELLLWNWVEDVVLARGETVNLTRQMALSADESDLYYCGGYAVAELGALDARTLRPLRSFHGHTRGVHGVALGRGKKLASVSLDFSVRVLDEHSDAPFIRLDAGFDARSMDADADGSAFATASMRGEVRVWNARSLALELALDMQQPLRACALSREHLYLAGERLWVLERATGKLLESLELDPGITRLLLSRDERTLVGAWISQARWIAWNLPAFEVRCAWDFAWGGLPQLADDAETILVCGRESDLFEIDFGRGAVERLFASDRPLSQAVRIGDHTLVTTSRNVRWLSDLLVWDGRAGTLRTVQKEKFAFSIDASPDGQRLVTAGELLYVSTPQGRELLSLGGMLRPLTEVRFVAGGERIVGKSSEIVAPTYVYVYSAPQDADLPRDP